MKMKLLQIAMLLAGVYALAACSDKENETVAPSPGRTPVTFLSFVADEQAEAGSRAVGTSWSAGDEIGIFMIEAGAELSAGNILNDASNIMYSTSSGTAQFLPGSGYDPIYLPEKGSVDFIAYYPFQQDMSGYAYDIDLSDQSSIEKLDLLYSDNAKGVNTAGADVEMTFTRQLTKLTFSITTTDYESLTGLKATLSGQPTKGTFDLATKALNPDGSSIQDFGANLTVVGKSAKAEAIVFPVSADNRTVVTFELPDGQTFRHSFPSTAIFEKGHNYTYEIVLHN